MKNNFTIVSPYDEFGEINYDLIEQAEILAKKENIGITRDREINELVLNENEKVIGASWISFDGSNYEFDVVVSNDYQHQGIGTTLVDSCIEKYDEYKSMYEDSTMNITVVSDIMISLLNKKGFQISEKIGNGFFKMNKDLEIKNIKNFIDNKKVNYVFVEEKDFENFFKEVNRLDWRNIATQNRDYIFAILDKNIVGFSILAKTYNNNSNFKDVITLSNIEVHKDYRNQGIGTNIINKTLDIVKNSNMILKRSRPEEDGEKYIFNKITNSIKDLNIPCIPYNLDFVFSSLENKVFNNGNFNHHEKIEMMNKVAETMLLNPAIHKYRKLNDISDISLYMFDFAEPAIDSLFSKKNNLKFKIK